MNIGVVDLNLFKIFIVIWELCSLIVVVDCLYLIQFVVSYVLCCLCEMFDDLFFVCSISVMVFIEIVICLYEFILCVLGIIYEVLYIYVSFDLVMVMWIFYLVMLDMFCSYVLLLLMEELVYVVLYVFIEVQQMVMENLGVVMCNGDIDLVFGYLLGLFEDCQS